MQYPKSNEICNKIFKDMYSSYFSAINTLRMYSKVLFANDEWTTSGMNSGKLF